jgi:hypothetical protein
MVFLVYAVHYVCNDWDRLRPFVVFDTIQNNGKLRINTSEDYKVYMEKNAVYGSNVEITAIFDIYKGSVGIYFVSHSPTVVIRLVATERNVMLCYQVNPVTLNS